MMPGFVSGWEEEEKVPLAKVVNNATKRGSTPSLVESFILAWVAG